MCARVCDSDCRRVAGAECVRHGRCKLTAAVRQWEQPLGPPGTSELWKGERQRPPAPLALASSPSTLPLPLSPPQPPGINHSLLRFCFFGFDRLRFDWSSSNRFGGYGGRGGWLFFCFFLTDTGSVGQRLGRFAGITVHFLGFASYLFALLLFREEPLRGLKHLCSLLCLKKRETTTEEAAALPKPVNQPQFEFS